MKNLLLSICYLLLVISADAYSIELDSGEKECFSIELKAGQPCSGSYEVITEDATPIVVSVTGPSGTLHYKSTVPEDKSNGLKSADAAMEAAEDVDSGDAFQFDAENEGDYTMCLHFDDTLNDDKLSRTLAFNFRATNSRGSGEYNGLESELDALQRGLDTLKDHQAYMSQRENVRVCVCFYFCVYICTYVYLSSPPITARARTNLSPTTT